MHALGHVDGRAAGAEVGVAADQHGRAGRRHRVGRKALIGQHGQGDGVELDLAQHRGVVLAAAGIGVDQFDQLGHGVDAVAEDLGRLAAGGGHHPIAHDQQPIVVAGGELLDQHRLAFLPRRFVGRDDLLAGGEIGGHAAALVAVLRLDDHRHADLAGGGPGVVGVLDRPAVGRRHAHGAEQHAGHFLVLGNRLGDGAGAVGLGRLNAALLPTVAEQHQALGIQPPVGDVAGFGPLGRWRGCSARDTLAGPGRGAARFPCRR